LRCALSHQSMPDVLGDGGVNTVCISIIVKQSSYICLVVSRLDLRSGVTTSAYTTDEKTLFVRRIDVPTIVSARRQNMEAARTVGCPSATCTPWLLDESREVVYVHRTHPRRASTWFVAYHVSNTSAKYRSTNIPNSPSNFSDIVFHLGHDCH